MSLVSLSTQHAFWLKTQIPMVLFLFSHSCAEDIMQHGLCRMTLDARPQLHQAVTGNQQASKATAN